MIWIVLCGVTLAVFVFLIGFHSVVVRQGEAGLLYRHGAIVKQLEPGRHRWFEFVRLTSARIISVLREAYSPIEVGVMTKDQFSFRIGFAPVIQVTDARAYAEAVAYGASGAKLLLAGSAITASRYPEMNAALSAAAIEEVGRHTLEEFLAQPSVIVPAIATRIEGALPGSQLRDLLITAITMPPEVRKMFTEVERAKREALAALEKAHGEQASLRALANAARVLHNNPQLAQLRLLQTVEASKGPKTIVLGALPSLGGGGTTPE